MPANSTKHFTRFRFAKGVKWLFNPVLKKRFANRPEERVRLQYVEYLIAETDINKNRIGFEAPIRLEESENTLRADLVLYHKNMEPFALIECKSPTIRLNHSAAEQIARYNRRLNADYLMITNGTDEFWYKLGNQLSELVKSPIRQLKKPAETGVHPDYWIERGFISSNSDDQTKSLAKYILHSFQINFASSQVQYLDLPISFTSVQLGHYYYISNISSDKNLALSILNNGEGNTLLAGVLNQNGKNRGILWINLDRLASTTKAEINQVTPSGKNKIVAQEDFSRQLLLKNTHFIKNLGEQLLIFFD